VHKIHIHLMELK